MNKPFSHPSATFSTLVELLRWRASHEPDVRTYSFLADTKAEEVRLSNEELDRKARKIACLLQSMGAAGERALLLHPPGLEYIAALYGCLYAGVVAVPAYPPRLNQSGSRISAIVNDAQATLALTTTPILSKVEGRRANVPGLGSLRWLATDDLEDDLASGWQDPGASSETLAALQYTSGSTAAPKGVMLTHGNMLHNLGALRRAFDLSPQSRGVLWGPPYHDMGLFVGLLQPLYSGFPMWLMPPVAFVQNPFLWLQTISRHRATFSGGPDFAYTLCVHKIPPEQRKTLDLSSWKVAFNGAEPVNVDTLDQFEAAFGACGFRREAFYPSYGLAEASLIISAGGSKAARPVTLTVQRRALENNLVRFTHQEDRGSQTLVGCGEVAGGQRVVIADPHSLTECRPDQVGEIWVSGPSVAQGYWKQPEATRHDFFAYLTDTKEGPFLRTGDLGFLYEGELFPTGRLKDLLIIRGGNYYPQDIELVAEQSHPALRPRHSAAFTARFEDEEQLVIVCEVERTHRKSLDADEAVRKIRRAVAEQYELQVYAVVLARPGSVPQTSSGKVQRRSCKEMFLSGSLEALRTDVLEADDSASKEHGLHQPVSTEVAVANIWEDVLNLEEGDVRRDEDFFDIGGHSLAAAQVMARINQRFGVELLPGALFDAPTVTELALAVTQAQAEAEPEIEQMLAQVEEVQDRSVSRGNSGMRNDRATRIAKLTPEQRRLLEHELQERTWARADEGISPLPRHSESDQPPVFPLSSVQWRLWMGQSHPGSNAHNVPPAVRLRGQLDIAALEAGLSEVCVRHEALRTTFSTRDGEPVQIVGPPRPVPLTRVDLRELPPSAREAEAERLLVREARRPFDLANDLMLRATLLCLNDEEHVLLLVMHHIASDGWSVDVLFRELSALYNASRSGGWASLPELPVQYADYAVWQQRRLQNDEAARLSMEYWKEQLANAPKTLLLPTDRPSPAVRKLGGARQELWMPDLLGKELRALCRMQNVTPFVTLLAAWATLLHRYSGQDDILIRTPFANRNRVEIEGLIGSFSDVLVLRHDLTGDPSFTELLGRVRDTTVDASSHSELPFEELKEMHRNARVGFVLQDTTLSSLKLDRLQAEQVRIDRGETARLLTLRILEGHDGLTARLDYNPDLFEPATVYRMLEHLRTLLQSVVDDPEQRISELPLPVKAERPSAADLAAAARRQRRDRPAPPTRDGGRPTRFRKRLRRAARRARRLAGQLRARIKNGPFFG